MQRNFSMMLSTFVLATLILRAAVGLEGGDDCGLFLAETIDEHGALTMGVFSAVERPAGSLVGYPDAVLPLIDVPIHNSPTHEDSPDFWWLFDHLVWDANDVGGVHEGVDVKSAVLGLGSLTRGSPQERNVFLLQSHFDAANLDRAQDPGAGAITYYPGAALVATHDIEAGEELFFHENAYRWYLNPQDQEKFIGEHHENIKEPPIPEQRSRLWGLLESPIVKARNLLPASWGGQDSVPVHPEKGAGKKSPEWLRAHGMCMDNLIQGPSKIEQAGRGAFATRTIKENALVAPAPLVHILDKASLNMYQPQMDENFKFLVSEEVVGQQLLLNYCFGHHESTKLLCPIGSSTGFINHSPSPNAALRWSTHQSHQKDWLNMTIDELGSKLEVGLILEYYALRDIAEDEEITVDYGQEWEDAWKRHTEEWNKPAGADNYVSADVLNAEDHTIVRTVEEQKENPYPYSIVTSCYFEYVHEESPQVDDSGTYADPREQTVWVKDFVGLDASVPDYLFVRPCRVLERSDSNHYTVQILNYDHQHRDQLIPDTHMLIVRSMPRDALTFTDFAYTTDLHLRGAFRHEMMLPDSLFPEAWRNLHT